MATMMIMIIVMIFYIWIQWFCSLKNHERYRYLWRKIMKDINIYDATGIERVMKRLSIDIASVFSKLIASYDVTLSCASAFYLSRDDFISKIWQLPLQQEGGVGVGRPQKLPKKEMSRNVLAESGGGWAVFLCLASGRLWGPESIFGGGCIPSASYVKLKPSKGYYWDSLKFIAYPSFH